MATPDFLASLLSSGQFSDFKLICDGQEFNLHQAIACPQSPVLNAALCGNFKEATSKATTVDGFDASTVKCMVSFLYTRDYEVNLSHEEDQGQEDVMDKDDNDQQPNDNDETGDNDGGEDGVDAPPEATEEPEDEANSQAIELLVCHLNVNAIANYYDIEKLRDLAKSKIEVVLKANGSILPRLLREVSISNTHINLYPIIASATAENNDIGKLLAQEDLRMVELDPALSREIIAACGERIIRLETQLKDAQREVAKHCLISQSNAGSSDTCLATLVKTQDCWDCGLQFNCLIDLIETVSIKLFSATHHTYMLRCKGCRTRHA